MTRRSVSRETPERWRGRWLRRAAVAALTVTGALLLWSGLIISLAALAGGPAEHGQ